MCDFIKSCYAAPRINKMADFFSSTASGVKHKPLKHVKIDNRLFPSPEYIIFSDYLTKNSGPFVNHYFCSIPYSKEEECRLGVTIMKYASHRNKPLSLWCLGMAEGAMARTISQLSKGQVLSLTTSPTKENEPVFFSHGSHIHSYFICSPFFLVHEEIKNNNPELFPHGFDIIIEDTTFQMYSPDREQQIKHVKKTLKDDGIFIFTEKFSTSTKEYQIREYQKDFSFKQRYFSQDEIDAKKENILNIMNLNEVTLERMITAIKSHFKYYSVYWNSGNFYSIAASNSQKTFLTL